MKTMLFLLCLVSFAASAQEKWVSNKDHSEILFKIPYLEVSEVTGRFTDYQAQIEFDDKMLMNKVTIKISSDSIDTAQKLRDSHLKREEFFAAQRFPHMEFVSSKVKSLGKDKYSIEGQLTVKGITKPLSVQASLSKEIIDTWGHKNRFIKFSSKMNRKDFNIKWNKALDEKKFLVGEQVDFWGVFQIQPFNDQTPASKHMIPDTEYIREREEKIRKQKKNEPKPQEASEDESAISKSLRKLINGK